jgi:mannose-6-phosphate isomerase-like protein (cupin superfamily)
MKRVKLRLGKGFHVAIGNERSQAAQMVLEPGENEGGKGNHHRGADQWLYVVSGRGVAIIAGKRTALLPQNTGTTALRTVSIYVPPAYAKGGDTLPPGRP